MAAFKLQKVYKSFRTRGRLADYAILIEQSGSRLFDKQTIYKSNGSSSQHFGQMNSLELGSGLLSRQRTTLYK
ncbi:unnamed protein product [Trifolium pratense]|uniref:Uncharacterized protein n=1 Tax=Trifolium pratense TaxID=57577 RepID=A0ACB0M1T1_TRIPR|nr:unnamed protein product [Trifolium pratense]